MPTTSNFGWNTPANTDLVKDGAAAIRTLGNNIDASLVDLKGGTTGQVLAKASNADLDYTWSNVDPLTILDAKGDLITATAADTPARLAVGTNGQYLQADSTTATGLKWATVSAGGMTQLATGTLSGTTVSLTNIDQTYNSLRLWVYDASVTSTGGNFGIRVNNINTLYRYTVMGTGANTLSNFNSRSSMEIVGIVSGQRDVFAEIVIPGYALVSGGNVGKVFYAYTNSVAATESTFILGANDETAANAPITRIDIIPPSSFDEGTYILWGIK